MKPTTDSCACPGFRNVSFSRRHLLKVGGLGLLGLTMPRLLRAAESQKKGPLAKAKSVIFLYQFGGPSHIDMFDMKPEAPEAIRGSHKPAATKADGIAINERLPRLAKVMDKVTLIRSVHHHMKNHNPASYYALTGHAPPVDDITLRDSPELFPAPGSVIDKLAPAEGAIPTFVALPWVIGDGTITPGQHASFLGKVHDPLLITRDPSKPDFKLPELNLPASVTYERLTHRRSIQKIIDGQSRLLEYSAKARGMDAYYEKALAMLDSPKLREVFNLSAEPDAVRDSYGRTAYGQSCLLARRLVEVGTKFVTVHFSANIGGDVGSGWDTHGNNGKKMFPILEKYHLPMTDQTLPTLLEELDQRGLLDTTLVVWMGEFGRTPKINEKASRDHWPDCYTVLLAGGGVKRGFVYGASNKTASYPAENPVRPEDLAATIYYLLGIDPHTEVYGIDKRPLPISEGTPVTAVIA
ncbi:MAG: DUF1501 domain-containing protein [Verrucomicrobia bacterium]|nr:DUF1501 domain-containing protein [Verrucomicrobiota bacterium]